MVKPFLSFRQAGNPGVFFPSGERMSVRPRRNSRSSLSRRTIETDPLRYCATCDRTLLRELFGRDASKASGLKSICLECDREKARAYHAATRAARLRREGPSSNVHPATVTAPRSARKTAALPMPPALDRVDGALLVGDPPPYPK
jgi:hypothetical protein